MCRIQMLKERIEYQKECIEKAREMGEDTVDLQVALFEDESELAYAWADQEAEINGWM